MHQKPPFFVQAAKEGEDTLFFTTGLYLNSSVGADRCAQAGGGQKRLLPLDRKNKTQKKHQRLRTRTLRGWEAVTEVLKSAERRNPTSTTMGTHHQIKWKAI